MSIFNATARGYVAQYLPEPLYVVAGKAAFLLRVNPSSHWVDWRQNSKFPSIKQLIKRYSSFRRTVGYVITGEGNRVNFLLGFSPNSQILFNSPRCISVGVNNIAADFSSIDSCSWLASSYSIFGSCIDN